MAEAISAQVRQKPHAALAWKGEMTSILETAAMNPKRLLMLVVAAVIGAGFRYCPNIRGMAHEHAIGQRRGNGRTITQRGREVVYRVIPCGSD